MQDAAGFDASVSASERSTAAPSVHRKPRAASGPRGRLAPPPPLKSADPTNPTARLVPPAPSAGSIIEQHPAAPQVHITHETSITGATAEALWESYYSNFKPLEPLAILQHCYTREEVLAEFANPNIVKIVGWQDGVPVGLGMVTNSLDDVPQISPAFLRAAYPEHAAANTIYFGILVMVAPGVRGLTLFSRISIELWQVAALAGGVLVYDICDFNRITFDADTLSQRIADNFPQSSVKIVDRQTWYAAELPKPLPARTMPPEPTLF